MRLAQPPGRRTTYRPDGVTPGDGGSWDMARRDSKGSTAWLDFEKMFDQLAPLEVKMLRSEIKDKMALGQKGCLLLGKASDDADVCFMEITENVLELRFDTYNLPNPKTHEYELRIVRAYFSEPANYSGKMFVLSLESKSCGQLGKSEQNKHALAASRLATTHGLLENIL